MLVFGDNLFQLFLGWGRNSSCIILYAHLILLFKDFLFFISFKLVDNSQISNYHAFKEFHNPYDMSMREKLIQRLILIEFKNIKCSKEKKI